MSATETLRAGLLGLALVVTGCSGDDDPCAKTATFVLKNATTQELLVEAPFAVQDSVFAVAIEDSAVLGEFTGAFSAGYPDVRSLMGCLSAWSVAGDTLVYRLGPVASGTTWVVDEIDDCRGTFTLTLTDDDLGFDGDVDSTCVDFTALPR